MGKSLATCLAAALLGPLSFTPAYGAKCSALFARKSVPAVNESDLPAELIRAQVQWKPEYFSKPDPSATSFTYIVHGYSGFTNPDGQMASARDLFDFLSKDLQTKDNYTISTSIVSESHTRFYGKVGFILKASEKSIIAAGPDDIGTIMQVSSAEFLKTYAAMHFEMNGLPSPKDLLAKTSPDNYNEVAILVPGVTGHPIEIVGVVIHTDPNVPAGRVTAETVREFEELARIQNLPIIYLR